MRRHLCSLRRRLDGRAPTLRGGGLMLQRAGDNALRRELPRVESPERARALTCCLVGPTNAGKSTLLNALINEPVSAVSDKIHTTRENTLGYLTDGESATQVEFVDAPGALGPDVPALHRALWDAVRTTELALVVVDSSDVRSHRQVGRFLGRLERELAELEALGDDDAGGDVAGKAAVREGRDGRGQLRPQTALVLNKVDRVRHKERVLRLSHALHARFAFDGPSFFISARTGDGVDHLRGWLLLQARPGEWIAPAGVAHVQPPLARATELIRELIFTFFSKELPYLLEQRNIGWTELTRPAGALRIDQQLVLPKERRSVKRIVERRLPGLAKAARARLRDEFGCEVFLHLSIGFAGTHDIEALQMAPTVQGLAARRHL